MYETIKAFLPPIVPLDFYTRSECWWRWICVQSACDGALIQVRDGICQFWKIAQWN